MLRLVLARLLATAPVLVLVTVGVFAMLHLAPGDPVSVLVGDQAVDPATIAGLRREYGLDDPLPVQYATWLGRAARGDLGYSFATRQPVAKALADRLPVTAALAAAALVLALAVALPLGVLAAVRRHSAFDLASQALAAVGGSMPSFWLGIILILTFAQNLRLLPPSGFVALTVDPVESLRHLVLPAVTLAVGYAAILTRVVRASLLDVLAEDFVRTARAKGLAPGAVVSRHALRAALLPIVTIVGIEIGHVLGGAVLTETLFALPGTGRLLVEAIGGRDFPIAQGATLLLVVAAVLANLLADIGCGLADPRVRESAAR